MTDEPFTDPPWYADQEAWDEFMDAFTEGMENAEPKMSEELR